MLLFVSACQLHSRYDHGGRPPGRHALRGGHHLVDDFVDEGKPKPTKAMKAKVPSLEFATGNGEKRLTRRQKENKLQRL